MEKYISLDFLKMFLRYDVEKDRYYIDDIERLWGFDKEEMQPIIHSSWKKVGDKFFCEACSDIEDKTSRYCPQCGALMVDDNDNDNDDF